MKILSVRLKNLNALKGEWKIDFTQPPFDGSNLFAIVGATGAGKTTLLDAICLALYHETPRLQVSGKENQLMTHHTQESLAEVEFAVNDQVYRAFWSQRRAARSGNLQAPVVELAKADGEILASRQGDKKQCIEELTGLDFNRFTKSMLLSQGQFAAFLNADNSERAGLLEKLTGTEVYGRISEQVFLRHRQEQETLERLKLRLEGVELLSPEQLEQHQQQLQQHQAHQQQLNPQYETLQGRISALNRLEQLWDNQQQAEAELKQAKEARKSHKETLKALEKAIPAQKILPDYRALQELDHQLAQAREQQQQLQARLEQQQEQLTRAQQGFDRSETALKADQQHKAQAETRLNNELAPLDEKIRHLSQQIQELQTGLSAEQQALQQLDTQQLEQQSRQQQLEQREHQDRLWLEQHPGLNAIAEALPHWQEQLQQRHSLHQQIQQLQRQHQQSQQERRQQQQQFAPLESRQADYHTQHRQLEQQLEALQQHQKQHPLQDEEAGRQLLNRLQQLQEPAQNLLYHQEALTRLNRDIQARQQEIQQSAEGIAPLEQQRSSLREEYKQLSQHLQDLEQLFAREQQINDLQEARSRLQPEEACPLCGSHEHPAVEAYQAIELSRTEQRLQQQRQKLEQVRQQGDQRRSQIEQLQVRRDTLQQDLQQKQQQLQRAETGWQQTVTEIQGIISAVFSADGPMLFTSGPLFTTQQPVDPAAALSAFAANWQQWPALNSAALPDGEAFRRDLRQLNSLVQQALEDKDALKQQIWQLAQQQQQQERQQHQLGEQLARLQQQDAQLAERLQQQANSQQQLQGQLEQLESKLSDAFSAQGQRLPEPDAQEAFLSALQQQVQQWQQRQHQQQQTAAELRDLQLQREHLQQQHSNQQQRCRQQQTRLDELQSQWQTLKEERHLNFGSATLEEERARLQQQIQQSEQQLEQSRKQLDRQRDDTGALKARLEQQSGYCRQYADKQQQAEKHWQQVLADSAFSSQAAFEKALPDPDEFEHWQQLKQQLDQALKEAEVTLRVNRQSLQQFVSTDPALKALSAKTAAAAADSTDPASEQEAGAEAQLSSRQLKQWLRQRDRDQAELQQLEQQREQVQTALTELRQILRLDEERRHNQQALAQQIDQQQQQSDLWEQMNHLIGSAKGDKFRRFAQGLTLEYLIELANRQLLQLHDRYQLRRKSGAELAIEILDTWQADAVRDTRTLSGGESFLVSLALALALSDLVSHKVRIDSLFLDEGFGTLDSETLEMALNALDNLNASGKMIGVISHISAMKERIPVQIKVHKKPGLGISELESRYRFSPDETLNHEDKQ